MRLPQDRILHIDTELAGDEVRVVMEWQGELVRCKDCRWYEKPKAKIFENCCRNDYLIPMKPDDYCSYGERRE